MSRRIVAILSVAGVLGLAGLSHADSGPEPEKSSKAKAQAIATDTTKTLGVYTAKGTSPIDTKVYDLELYRKALTAAVADACNQIGRQMKGNADETLVWQAAELEGRPMVLPRGVVEVTVRVAEKKILALKSGEITARLLGPEKQEPPQPNLPPMPPTEKKEEQAVPKIVPEDGKSKPTNATDEKAYTGLVIDATGLDFTASMAPKVLTESGQAILSADQAKWSLTETLGLVGYVKTMRDALADPRVGGRPYVIQGLRAGKKAGEIVVPDNLLEIMTKHPEVQRALESGRVVIVGGHPKE